MQIDRRHPGAGLGGQQQGGAAGAAAEIEHPRSSGQRAGERREGEQPASGVVRAWTLPRKTVVQGEEGVVHGVVGQRGNP